MREAPPREFKSQKNRAIESGVWFKLDIGRTRNADPKWLLPMLCRKGNISKQDLGAIKVYDNETKFEVAGAVASQFAANMKKPGGENIRVERLGGDGKAAPSEKPPKRKKPKYVAKADRGRAAEG